jgi:glycosyltransferase involved in cell wall biosynthesis
MEQGALTFLGPRKPSETPRLYSAARVSVNLTASGNYDKTVLESMACGTPAIVSSEAFADIIPERWRIAEHDTHALAQKIDEAIRLPEKEYAELGASLRAEVVEKQSLSVLARELSSAISSL